MIVGICSDIDINENCVCGKCKGKCMIMNTYSEMVIECGFVPIILPNTDKKYVLDKICKIIDVLLICGNKAHPRNNTIPSDPSDDLIMMESIHNRDTYLVDKMIEMKKKVIGICYGMEFLNSYFNGKIYLDIVKELSVKSHMKTDHSVEILPNTKLYDIASQTRDCNLYKIKNNGNLERSVNSYHFAGITPDIFSKNLIINTVSDDGIVEGFEDKEGNIFGFQFHIEKHKDLFYVFKSIVNNQYSVNDV